jgi:SAM-dependent methyltransferase
VADTGAPRNLYDDAAFFAGYSRLARFGDGWSAAFEHTAFMSLLPSPAGSRVLDLGCGAGQLVAHLATEGARLAVGVDLSRRMLALARERAGGMPVSFVRAAMEGVAFAPASFDLVVSSLAVHYVPDWEGLCARIAAWLAPGGVFAGEGLVLALAVAAEAAKDDDEAGPLDARHPELGAGPLHELESAHGYILGHLRRHPFHDSYCRLALRIAESAPACLVRSQVAKVSWGRLLADYWPTTGRLLAAGPSRPAGRAGCTC